MPTPSLFPYMMKGGVGGTVAALDIGIAPDDDVTLALDADVGVATVDTDVTVSPTDDVDVVFDGDVGVDADSETEIEG